MRIALDVMGGDHAPEEILKGVVDTLGSLKEDDELVLVGNEEVIHRYLVQAGVRDDSRIEIIKSENDIGMMEIPVEAVRSKMQSSIVLTARQGGRHAEKKADIIISAGNTGAFVTAAQMELRRLKGVNRPGIGVVMPTFGGPVVICDVGANPEPKAHHLWQYGLMASVYAEHVLKIENPLIAQLNIGGEAAKGTESVKQARALFEQTPDCNYYGYVEGRQIFESPANVVVTDGFVGNTVLKLAEGMAAGLFRMIMREMNALNPKMAVEFGPIMQSIYAQHDYHEYGGAPLLGVNGVCVIVHGSANSRTIGNAILKSKKMVAHDLNGAILKKLNLVREVCVA